MTFDMPLVELSENHEVVDSENKKDSANYVEVLDPEYPTDGASQ